MFDVPEIIFFCSHQLCFWSECFVWDEMMMFCLQWKQWQSQNREFFVFGKTFFTFLQKKIVEINAPFLIMKYKYRLWIFPVSTNWDLNRLLQNINFVRSSLPADESASGKELQRKGFANMCCPFEFIVVVLHFDTQETICKNRRNAKSSNTFNCFSFYQSYETNTFYWDSAIREP